ncbi:hypothetical protein N878_06725 [Pseudomonas sp. EGD-AK9]|nr:hypothetical protein N878_06725 [Pseudomonas sp. EGD-AK9]
MTITGREIEQKSRQTSFGTFTRMTAIFVFFMDFPAQGMK